ncbi:ROK family protein [Planotetraspora sp. A-T 1434]|uniref:ROK family transcriptional regulator n=1 Tax=Planotetraspora sp. A-T 1434 TaxID=2979219 RepID=UPI0021C027CA|nr:ROK family protein [Planotetraspora sp. A-T 1434]MCT9932272.1 ROK family protein [Planotetraspora sp. A-T 1434]
MEHRAGSPQLLRQINDRAALLALLERGPLTRLELESQIGLSKPATADLLLRLERDGQLRRAGFREGGKGPRAQLWSVNGALAHVAAVDLTPQGLDVAVSDLRGEVVAEHRHRARKNVDLGVEDLRLSVSVAAAEVGLTAGQLRRVVVGLPGSVDRRTGYLGFAPHLPAWQGFDVLERLAGALGTSVAVENDVNLVALDEMAAGQAAGVDDFALIWIGQGTGAAVVSDGRLLRGASGGAGEIDWMPSPTPPATGAHAVPPRQRVGDMLSNDALKELARAHGLAGDDVEGIVSGDLDADPATRAAFLREVARRVALAVAGVVSVVDPELVVLAGDVGRAGGSALCDLVAGELAELVLPRPRIQPSLVTGNPVRSGALRLALAGAREEVFAIPS